MFPHLDLGGREIKPGALIVYPAAVADVVLLRYAIVTRLGWREKNGYDGAGPFTAKYPTLRVIAVGKNGYRDNGEWCLHRDGKEIALQYTSRVLMVDRDQLPVRPRELLIATYNAFIGERTR
jgi:hypothetical protein